MTTPIFYPGDVIRAISCNRMEYEEYLATAVVLYDNRVLQVYPYKEETPSYPNKTGIILSQAFNSVEEWTHSILKIAGLVELEVTSNNTRKIPEYEVWDLLKKPNAPIEPLILAPAHGIRSWEANAIQKVNTYLNNQGMRCYLTTVNLMAGEIRLSSAHIIYSTKYVESYANYRSVAEKPWQSLEDWFKGVRDGTGKDITEIQVVQMNRPKWSCLV